MPSLVELFFELHCDLPREAPGDDRTTAYALSLVAPSLPPAPRILDIGCGPGAQTFVLARETSGTITAVDVHPPYLERLEARAARESLAHRIHTVRASMTELPFADASFDAIWSEGAVYIMGFDAGLSAWGRLLLPGGALVVSELSWLTDRPAPEEAAFWNEAYPAMRHRDANIVSARAAGYEVIADVVLPYAAWFTEYLGPLERRIDAMEQRYAGEPFARAWLAEQRREIDVVRRWNGFGYVFYVLRKR